jgi:hypothetical protein
MKRCRLWVLVAALISSAVVASAQTTSNKLDPAGARILPGTQPDGTIRLHNTWALKPAGKQLELGDFPVNIACHPSGHWLAILHAGYGTHEVIIVDLSGKKQSQIVSRTAVDQAFYGLAFDSTGKKLYASGGEFDVVHAFDFDDGFLFKHQRINLPKGSFTGGLVVHPQATQLAVAGTWGHVVNLLPLGQASNSVARQIKLEMGSYPYTCLYDATRNRLLVSLWAKSKVAVIDIAAAEPKVAQTFATEKHPTEMLLSPDGKLLFVACANSTAVSVLDAVDGSPVQAISTALYPNSPAGNAPCSLSLTPDGQMLFVANADNNNVAVFNVSDAKEAKPLGFIPVGYHPTSVRYNPADKKLYVANGRGATTKANRAGPNPLLPANASAREYIGGLYRGTLTTLDLPDAERMVQYSKQAYSCVPLRKDFGAVGTRPEGNPIPGKVGEATPIKYCIYIVRENRTYDQVFGDIKEGNGDPGLCIFPEKVTPNAHQLARQFVLLDNFYVEAEVSADGHEWSMGAYCTDFVKKAWPLNYRGGKKIGYPAEGVQDEAARPAGGYLWDRCLEAGVSFRSYGEWVDNAKSANGSAKARVKALEGHIDPGYRGYDLDYSDIKRANRFIEELKGFEQSGKMPSLSILRLPNDHTYGARAGKLTPTACVAQNDQGLGMIVEALSNSKFWKETAIFVVEDDAQNGSDHVDAHRTVALIISPYTKRGAVDSTIYATSSMLRTMELVLGLQPMSQYDAAAMPMYNSFQTKPDFTPFKRMPAQVDIEAVNQKNAFGAALSEKMDFSREDAADDFLLNEIIWRSVRGPDAPMPPPVRAAFVFPK